jgi:hypothetical protein
MRAVRALFALVMPFVGACGGDDTSSTPSGTSSVGSSSTGPLSGSTSSTEPASSTSVADTSSGDATQPTTVDPTTGPPPPPKLCSLEAVDPLADPSIVEMGDAEGLLPTVIGEALLRNCGCHYSDNPDVAVDYLSDAVLINTWADFHVPFVGVFPMGFEDRTVWEATRVRVVDQMPVPMPSVECDVEGEDGVITEADKALFEAWFDAGAPDGASFEYP